MNGYKNGFLKIVILSFFQPLSPANSTCQESQAATYSPVVWTSLTTGKEYKIRMDSDHLYIDGILPAWLRQAEKDGAFFRCNLARGESKWTGTCTSYMPYHWTDKSGNTQANWCRIETMENVTLVTKIRIEGEYETLDQKGFDASKCLVKKGEMAHFAWIPKK